MSAVLTVNRLRELGEKQDVEAVLSALRRGLAAVEPFKLVAKHLRRRGKRLIVDGVEIDTGSVDDFLVLAAGKAAAPMASAVLHVLGDVPVRGVVAVPRESRVERPLPLEIFHAGHPTPDEDSVKAGQAFLEHAKKTSEKSFAIILISGGSSALAASPADGITLDDKKAVTKALMNAGASIHELNTVRKHLSSLKGGMLAKTLRCRAVSLILSDVVGDQLDVIGSGPTVPDPSTYQDALNILRKYRIQPPPNVLKRLEDGAAGAVAETPKPGDPAFTRVSNIIVGKNADAVKAAAAELKGKRYRVVALTSMLVGEARETAKLFASLARDIDRNHIPQKPPAAIVAGGETTVTVKGTGRGGRNQELVLATCILLKNFPNFVFASMGTDGVDGPTDAAGALCTGKTNQIADSTGLQPEKFLENNDAYNFFHQAGGLIKTGPTGTNVGDLTILVVTGKQTNPTTPSSHQKFG
ncbi:MAG: glycerate kinase [Candidatus Caldarchaeum sp.]|nr:glycerate kinase [Candidatus Caldarchaeum sp.]MDW8435423.1 glycerate kinase [Candidatus Caldarchaeum sp.]